MHGFFKIHLTFLTYTSSSFTSLEVTCCCGCCYRCFGQTQKLG